MAFLVVARFKRSSIKRAMKKVKRITVQTHQRNVVDVHHDYQTAFAVTWDTTMVATGHTRSKLFYKRTRVKDGTIFRFGYGATKNNQSVMQEFGRGKVHRKASDHIWFDEAHGGSAICSRNPEDLWAAFGMRYQANPKAKRRAMYHAINRTFFTRANKVAVNGGNFFYMPSFRGYAKNLSQRTRRYLNTLGVS